QLRRQRQMCIRDRFLLSSNAFPSNHSNLTIFNYLCKCCNNPKRTLQKVIFIILLISPDFEE
ncbi:hypothetical protein KQJ29_24260, partial [Enterococcus sp. S181_ASV_20]|nr:hypothetical protein [Enterococcus sp. S181_ASV_20]